MAKLVIIIYEVIVLPAILFKLASRAITSWMHEILVLSYDTSYNFHITVYCACVQLGMCDSAYVRDVSKRHASDMTSYVHLIFFGAGSPTDQRTIDLT